MTKKEIELAAGNYSGKIQGLGGYPGVDMKHKAFIEGATWRINCVWNDKEIKPDVERYILAIGKNGMPFIAGPNNSDWRDTVESFGISKWAYVQDLMIADD